MKRFVFALLLLLMLVLTGCGMEQSTDSNDAAISMKTVYSSDISAEDCYLCGGGTESPLLREFLADPDISQIPHSVFYF